MTELQPVWANSLQTVALLGVSRRRLDDLRKIGVLEQGIDYRLDGEGGRSPVRYHLERTEQKLLEHSGKSSAGIAARQGAQA